MSENHRPEGYLTHLNRLFEKIGTWSYDHRRIVAVLCILIVGCGLFLGYGVRFDNSFESFFAQDDPVYSAYLEYREDFGSDEISYIIYEAPAFEHGPWNLEVMRRIQQLTEAIETETPFVRRAVSLANVELLHGADGELIIYDLASAFPQTQEALLKIRDKVMARPMYVGGLVSADERYGGIIVEMDRSSIDPLEEIMFDSRKGISLDNLYPQVTYFKIEDILRRDEYSGITFYHSGDVPLNATYNIITEEDAIKLGSITVILVAGLLYFFYRRISGVAGPMLVVLSAIIMTVGFIGVLGWDFDLMFIVLPTLLVAIGVAVCVHVVTEMRIYTRRLGDKREAIRKTLHLVGVPCLFTCLTTVAGILAMSISPIKALRHFAIYSAFGIFLTFVLSMTLLLVVLSAGSRPERGNRRRTDSPAAKESSFLYALLLGIARFDIRNRGLIIGVSVAIFILCVAGLLRLDVDYNWLNDFAPRVEVRRNTEMIDGVMGGTGGFTYVFDTKTDGGVLDPGLLRHIDALQQRAAEAVGFVMKTYSIVDLIKDIHMTFNDGDPDYYEIPDSRELIAQYLLLYEMSGGDELWHYITSDHAKANVEIRCRVVNTSEYFKLVEELDAFLRSIPDLTLVPELTGVGALWIALIDYIVKSQIQGFLLAFCVIACMVSLLFKSVKVGLIAMIPTLAPVLLTLGGMGWFGVPLDYVKLLIGCLAIGIAVDDTIHLLARLHHSFCETGNYHQAVMAAMKDVGRALFITTVVLVSSFSVMLFSKMSSLGAFGALVGVTLSSALIAVFFLLPALVLVFKPFGPEVRAAAQ